MKIPLDFGKYKWYFCLAQAFLGVLATTEKHNFNKGDLKLSKFSIQIWTMPTIVIK
jgi:hypothetical protein